MTKPKALALILASFVFGVILGGYLFADSRPRSFLALNNCGGTCLQGNELLGLVASVGIQNFSALAPKVVKETDKTIVIQDSSPEARIHYLVIPKKDIKNISEVSDADADYLLDAIKVTGEIVREKNLINYRLITNGPGYQSVTYLHFHLMSND
ncbi:MAG TPA: HIT domain-containing protein [Pyrinomonadaceae bacterium]|nr:HIT domain-containing protein [Pyrinomonadaceae bacterium]